MIKSFQVLFQILRHLLISCPGLPELKELGHPTRLAVFKRLVKSGHQGLAVGVVQEELGIPGSTLSHHLSSLASAGLITQRREGRTLYCVAEYRRLTDVVCFLQHECCADETASPA